MDKGNQLGLALGLIFGIFCLVVLAILVWMWYKHKRQQVSFKKNERQSSGRDLLGIVELESLRGTGSNTSLGLSSIDVGDDAAQTQATKLIPFGLNLLKSCKSMIHRILATCIDQTSTKSTHHRFMIYNLDQIVDSTQGLTPLVDDFTKSMYPPLDPHTMQKASYDLFRELSEVVDRVKLNSQGDISWLDVYLNRIKSCHVKFNSEINKLRQTINADTSSNENIDLDGYNNNCNTDEIHDLYMELEGDVE